MLPIHCPISNAGIAAWHAMSMRRFWSGSAATLWLCMASAEALPPPQEITFTAPVYQSEETIELRAYLYRSDETGPHPAIVDLHGCNGIWSVRSNPWIEHYLKWGFAVLQVDSFGPRGRDNICGSLFAIPTWHRAQDAHAAKRWLLAQPWVAKEDIFLTGFSHGATTVLLTLHDDLNASQPFAGAIATAPWCLDQLGNSHTDLLILIGGEDQWTPAQRCRVMISARPKRVELVVYEDAYHSFDAPGVDSIYQGQRVAYNAKAAQDAVRRAHKFLMDRLSLELR